MRLLFKKLDSQQGFLTVGAAIAMVVLGFFAVASSTFMNHSIQQSADDTGLGRAQAYADAGAEWAMTQVNNGQNPSTAGMPGGVFAMEYGSFAVEVSPPNIMVTGQSGQTQVTRNFDTFFASDCVSLQCDGLYLGGLGLDEDLLLESNKLYGTNFKLVKTCLNAPAMTRFKVQVLNEGILDIERLSRIEMEGHTLWSDLLGVENDTWVNLDTPFVFPSGPGVQEADFDYLYFLTPLLEGKTYNMSVGFADSSEITVSCEQGGEEGGGDETPGYEVDDGEIVVDPYTEVKFEVLCSEITHAGEEIEVKMNVASNGVYTPPWLFNNSDVDGGEIHIEPATSAEVMSYKVKAKADYQGIWNYTTQSTNTLQVKTLVDGDAAPLLAGYGGQRPVSECIAPYLDEVSGEVELLPSQVILLFELGVDLSLNPGSLAADFQDLVVLATVTTQ